MPEETKAAAVAMYAEFRKKNETFMLFILPEDIRDGNHINPIMWSRTISAATPQKPWRYAQVAPQEATLPKGRTNNPAEWNVLPNAVALNRSSELLRWFSEYFKHATPGNGWVIQNFPFFVEASATDMEMSGNLSMPGALVRRIDNAKAAYGFPSNRITATDPLKPSKIETRLPNGEAVKVRGALDATLRDTYREMHPDLYVMMMATLSQRVNPTLGAVATQNVDIDEARARGRSVAGKTEVAVEKPADPDLVVKDDEKFIRPNGEEYFPRKWGQYYDVAVLRKARKIRQNVFFKGEPGCGKTALVEGTFGEELYTIVGDGDTEASDFLGSYVAMPDGTFVWHDGPLIKAMEEGKPLLIDEVGLIDTKALSVAYGAMDGRGEVTVTANPARGTIKAKEGFFVIGATNPKAPGVRLSEALLSRFSLHAEVTTSYALARQVGVPAKMVDLAENLQATVNAGQKGLEWAPQFRELLAFRDQKAAFGEEFALNNMLQVVPENDRDYVVETINKLYSFKLSPAAI